MLAGALNDDIGSQEYVDTICGLHDLDCPESNAQVTNDVDLKEEEQSQIPFNCKIDHDECSDVIERSQSIDSKQPDLSARLGRMAGVVQALSQANTKSQAQLKALQSARSQGSQTVRNQSGHASRTNTRVKVSTSSQTDPKFMEDLQGYQQLCEIAGYVLTSIGHTHAPQDVAEALHPLLKNIGLRDKLLQITKPQQGLQVDEYEPDDEEASDDSKRRTTRNDDDPEETPNDEKC
ncbi:hypothetical protein FB446DRAFT_708818 [Lentinula raphanica]|nr:hypothetical protein FB446DRAFT_708818 [Lentinula raphanica]